MNKRNRSHGLCGISKCVLFDSKYYTRIVIKKSSRLHFDFSHFSECHCFQRSKLERKNKIVLMICVEFQNVLFDSKYYTCIVIKKSSRLHFDFDHFSECYCFQRSQIERMNEIVLMVCVQFQNVYSYFRNITHAS